MQKLLYIRQFQCYCLNCDKVSAKRTSALPSLQGRKGKGKEAKAVLGGMRAELPGLLLPSSRYVITTQPEVSPGETVTP